MEIQEDKIKNCNDFAGKPHYMCQFDKIFEFCNISVIKEYLMYSEKNMPFLYKDHNYLIAI